MGLKEETGHTTFKNVVNGILCFIVAVPAFAFSR